MRDPRCPIHKSVNRSILLSALISVLFCQSHDICQKDGAKHENLTTEAVKMKAVKELLRGKDPVKYIRSKCTGSPNEGMRLFYAKEDQYGYL